MTADSHDSSFPEVAGGPPATPSGVHADPFVDRVSAPMLGVEPGVFFAPGDNDGVPPGYPGPNTTGSDLTTLTSGDPNSIEYLRILYAEQNLRWAAYHESKLRARESARIGPYITDIGRVITARDANENRNYLFWRSHATTIKEKGGTPFSPNNYSAFDRKFEESDFPQITNPAYDSPGAGPESYSYWKPLRTNLAIVRSMIYAQYFPDGQFNPKDAEDQKSRMRLEAMAKELGGVFARSTLPVLGETLSALPVSLANVPDQGAQRIYKYLAANPKWGLAPVNETALSDAQLAAFQDATSDVSGINETLGDYLAKRAEQVKDMAIAAAQPRITPEQMDAQAQYQSIQEAKTILDKFRLQYSIATLDMNGKELPQARAAYGEPQEDIVMADQLTMLARIYEQNLRHLAAIQGGLDPEMQGMHKQTAATMGKLAFALRERAEWAVEETWDDPQKDLKLQHLIHTFPKDGKGQPLPAEWRNPDYGVKQPMLAYATGLYTSIQAVQGRIRLLQQDKGQDQRYTGLLPEVGVPAPPVPSQTMSSAVTTPPPSAPVKQEAVAQKQAQMTNFQQNHSANAAQRTERAAVRITQGSEQAAARPAAAQPNRLTAGLKPAQTAALKSSIDALKNFGMPQNAVTTQLNAQLNAQIKQRNAAKAAPGVAASTANSKAIGAFTAGAARKPGSPAAPTPPQPTAENVLPGSKNKSQWTAPGSPKGPGL